VHRPDRRTGDPWKEFFDISLNPPCCGIVELQAEPVGTGGGAEFLLKGLIDPCWNRLDFQSSRIGVIETEASRLIILSQYKIPRTIPPTTHTARKLFMMPARCSSPMPDQALDLLALPLFFLLLATILSIVKAVAEPTSLPSQ
jgi:hypothetical protein